MAGNTKEIELFGEKLILSARYVGDKKALAEKGLKLIKEYGLEGLSEDELKDKKFELACIDVILSGAFLHQALKNNLKDIPKMNFFQKLLMKFGFYKDIKNNIDFNNKLDPYYLVNNLTDKEVDDLKDIILYELEEGTRPDPNEKKSK